MSTRQLSSVDHFISEIDRGLHTLFQHAKSARPRPDQHTPDQQLSNAEIKQSLKLMRINHAGEVAAQALYHGQAITARQQHVRAEMEHAAQEETDHLAWCEHRIAELGGEPSKLKPFWYAGSFAIGAAAGLLGDRVSLGFIAETEKQVVHHLSEHLEKLPTADTKSRDILQQMRQDEAEHGENATNAGGLPLPGPVRGLMQVASKVMKNTAGTL